MQCLSGRHPQPPTLDHSVCFECAKELDQGYEVVAYQRTVPAWLPVLIGVGWILCQVGYAALAVWGVE